MSLIGDALKRTQQNTGPRPPRPQSARKPLMTTPAAAPSETTRNVLVFVLVGIFLLGGVALYGLWRMYSMFAANARNVAQVSAMETPRPAPMKEEPKPVPAPVAPPVREEVKPVVPAAPPEPPKVETPKVEPPKPEPVKVEAPKPEPVKVEPVLAPPPPPPPPPPPKEFPKLVLQGVTIQGGLREALINGQIVGVGDEVEGAKVVTIEQRKVKLLFDGREFTVTFLR